MPRTITIPDGAAPGSILSIPVKGRPENVKARVALVALFALFKRLNLFELFHLTCLFLCFIDFWMSLDPFSKQMHVDPCRLPRQPFPRDMDQAMNWPWPWRCCGEVLKCQGCRAHFLLGIQMIQDRALLTPALYFPPGSDATGRY